MSRRIDTSLATIQFQVNARQANAAMQALQEASDDLNRAIDKVNRNIANLGKDVPKDNPQLLNYQNQLAGLKKDLKDVEKAQRDFLKGAKAADQLWKAAQDGNIESLSFRSIKAGMNGLKKRQEGLSPGDAQDMKDWRIIKEVIDEADRVMKQAGADVQNVVQTIREGGKVSEQAMRQTINTLRELKGSVDETDAEYRTYGTDLDFVEAKLKEFNEAQRRAKGEIVDANDARREMNKLTEEGAAAAQREAEEAERKIAALHSEREELMAQREQIKQNIAATQEQIDKNHELIEEKHRQLAADEHAHNVIQDANHAHIESLKTQAEAERKLANEKSDAAETHRRAAELQAQTTEQLTEKVTELQGKLAALQAEPVKPKVDTTDIDALKAKLETLAAEKRQLEGKMNDFKFNEDMWEAYKPFESVFNRLQSTFEKIEQLPKITGRMITMGDGSPFKKSMMAAKFYSKGDIDFDTAYAQKEGEITRVMQDIKDHDAGYLGKRDFLASLKKDYEAIRDAVSYGKRLQGVEENMANPEVAAGLQRRVDMMEKLKVVYKEIYDLALQHGRTIHQKYGDDIYEDRILETAKEKEQAQKRLNEIDQESIGIQKQLAEAQQQSTQATDKLTEVQNLYNQKLQERIQKEKELEAIQNRSWTDDPEVKRLDAEIAKLEELIAVSEKYKKQFAKMSDAKFEEGYIGEDAEVKDAYHIKLDPKKSIWGAADYLRGAYNDRLGASLVDYAKEQDPSDQYGYVARYQKSAERVAKGVVENAQENLRRAILREIEDGNFTPEHMEEQIETFRSKMYQAAREAGEGNLKNDSEYNAYKYIVAQMEKYLEVAKKVQEERAKIAGGGEFLELAKHKDDIDAPREGLLRQKEKRDWDRATIKTEDIDRRRKDEEYTKSQEVEQAKRNEKEAERQLNEEKAKSNQQTEEELRLKGELETAQGKLAESKKRENDEQQEYVKLQAEAIEQGNKAAAAETKLADAQSEATQKQADFNQKQQEGLDAINQVAEGNKALQQSIDGLNGELEQNSKDITDNANKATEAEQQKQQARQLSIKRMEEMLAKLKEEYYTEELTAEQREEHIKQIQELEKAISTEKAKPMLQMMTERMQDVGSLSKSALEETRKFWEAMAQGADKGSEKLATAEAHIKALVEEEQKRSEAQAGKVIGNMGSYSDKEIAEAVKTFEQLRDAQTHGNDEWRKFNELVEKGKQHLEELAKADALAKMEERMSNLTNLSDAALAETKKYWEALKAGAEKGSEDLTKAETNLTRIIDLEKERTRIENERKAQIVRGGSLNMYSEAEITEAIKAAKELHSHMASADPAAQKLAESIAKAEAHIRQYGIEAARTAQRQEELDATMQKQFQTMMDGMRSGVMPSQAAVKSQMNYWQKLIDDPKTAAESLQFYRDQLAEVKKMYDFMIKSQGESALAWFQQGSDKDASGNQIKEMADKLKEYRGTLLKETNADEIAQIDTILQRIGASAKKATEELMDFEKAKELALQAGDDVYGKKNPAFLASPEEIQAATKSIEKYREELFKTIKAKRDSGEATDDEEAELQELAKYLKDLKFEQDNFNMSREKMEELMRTPVNATSIDELRAAIKRADAELKRMEGSLGQNNAQYKAFAEQVRNAKNQLKEMEGQAKASATAWEKAWSRLKTYVVMYMGFNAVWQKMVGTADDIMQLSDKMGEVRKTTGFTADEVGRLSDNLKRLDVRTPLVQLLEISAKAGQLGLKTEQDVMGFTEAANKLMIALPEMGAEAATEMMKVALATGEVKKIQDQLNKGIVEGSSATEVALSKIGSTIDQLRANSAAAAPQITDFVKRVGAVGAQSGITIDQVAALGATVDAVGLRVEMSATALSRMIPAIRNNAFEVAKAIGMTPNALREMFDEAGGGMEAMLAIFQHIKDSGMDEDSIEKMLGIGNMQDVMKQLNQQGARAGIVFAGLSQNVDELRRNLGVAKEAYEDNIAILQEYNKMNDTTAAKWERFKNQLEEFFVGDFTQRFLGGVIDFLRLGLDFLTGNNGWSAAFRTIGVYILAIKLNIAGIFSGVKNISFSLKGIAMAIGLIDKETKKLAWGNIFTAAAAAILWVVLELKNLKSALDKANESLGKTQEEIGRAKDRFEAYWVKLKDTSAALLQAKDSHEKLSGAVDVLRKTTDGSAESSAKLKIAEDELKNSEKNVTRASNDHKSAIAQMNSIYGKYLGFILTEANYSDLAAAAHDKVTAAIEREMLMKQKQAALGEVDSRYAQDIATGYGDLNERLVQYGGLKRSEAAKAMSDLQKFMRQNLSYDSDKGVTVVNQDIVNRLARKGIRGNASANEIAALWFDQYLKENYNLSDKVRRSLTGVERRSDVSEGWGTVWTPFASNLRGGYAKTYAKRENERGPVALVYDADADIAKEKEGTASEELIKKFEKRANDAKKKILNKSTDDKQRNEAYGELANALEGLDNRINELNPQKDAETINRLNTLATSLKGEGIDIKKLKQAREKIHQTLFERATFNEEDIRNLDTTNPWGGSHEASSTDWKNMTAEQLVNRRKQMKDFVNAIQSDTDVQAVLGEDAALKKAIEKGMSSDMRTVIEWYNTERLKIQDELHARHLTNTGDWMDPKKQRGAHKQFRDEMDAYLHELDAYYTERKTRIEEAGTDEGLTEAEIKNRTLNNEMEWQQRRAELQKLYSRKQKEVTEEELNAIYHIIAERTGDSEKFVKAQITKTNQFVDSIEKSGEKGAAIVHRWMSQVELDTERSYLKGQQALTKQMRAIEAIIDKERPFNGITKSLQESLATMDILTGEMRKEYNELMKQGADMTKFNERQNREEMKRTAFLLGEAENAYSTTIDHVMDDMRQKGMTAWADWLSADPKLQEALMAQLRSTYDAIQDAIKKEASQLKKQAEIMWNNILMPDGKTTLKQQTDRIVAQLGLDEGRVKRANSLIGAGQASERIADKLAIQQMKVQLAMQEHYYNLMKKQGQAHVDMLNAQAKAAKERGDEEEATRKTLDAQHAQMSLNLATSKEETELAKQREDIIARTEESQNRLYTELKSWADLLASSVKDLFEASHAGDAEYYNEQAKLNLTGKGGPGAGMYIVIDNEGTEDATAHYEYLDERQALERQHEIERENAQAEAWKKVMDDINMKLSETITDQLNAMLQNASVDANTQAVIKNTEMLSQATAALQGNKDNGNVPGLSDMSGGLSGVGAQGGEETGTGNGTAGLQPITQNEAQEFINGMGDNPMLFWAEQSDAATKKMMDNNKKVEKSTKASFAAMTAAANMYGIAYQTMANDNLDTTQKVEMMIVQAAGQAAISMLTASMAASTGETAANAPSWISKTLKELGPIGGPVAVGVFTALIGGLMGLATSKIAKSKSQIAQATGASASAGRLATGMLTYAEGNVNEFSNPDSLTVGRSYNVDGADGKTYRAKYMGKDAKTHITNGPEFHLVGEKGREAIIDAHTTRNIQLNEPEIWGAIKTLYNGGSLRHTGTRRGRGVRAFAEGNVEEFGDVMADGGGVMAGGVDIAAMTEAMNRQAAVQEALLERLNEPIYARNILYGAEGLPAVLQKLQQEAARHGEKYL